MNDINESVQKYYGETLSKTEDLKTNACCTLEASPTHIMKALSNVHDEVQAKYYGCGLTIPSKLEGLHVLDLGSGRDCYIAAQLVGNHGSITGIDMTKEQLAVANEYINYHADKFGYSNVKFLEGNIEKLDELSLEEKSFDLIISNCVINLATDKEKVLKDSYALLKTGGEMYFSDVYSSKRIPKELQEDQVLWGECLSGALYWNDFENISKKVGFADPRIVEIKEITVNNKELEVKVGDIKFYSITYRLFKTCCLESSQENYGQAVKYLGGIEESPLAFVFDESYTFKKNVNVAVDGNTFRMLKGSRYKENFEFFGDFSNHRGLFNPKTQIDVFAKVKSSSSGCC